MIDQVIVDKVKTAAKAQIEKIISGYIALKQAGVNYKGICPFHNENTESFIVNPAKGSFKCYGCGKFGDAIDFVQEFDRVSFPVAVKTVAKLYLIDIPERELTPEELSAHKKREIALANVNKQNETFRADLAKNEKAMEWLTKERGIAPDTIMRWGLGYAKAGFFAGRITYPMSNVAGEICGHTGRILVQGTQPKFKNSIESDIFKKSDLLFGLHYAKNHIAKADKCYLVEGQHDVLSMDQAGFHNTVAGSGTAITGNQIRAIKRFTKNIVLLLDGDKPGLAAAVKIVAPFLAEQINLRVIVLPEKEDPDSFLRGAFPNPSKGGEQGAKEYIERNEIDFIQFKTQHYATEIEADPSKQAKYLTEITGDIGLVEDKNTRRAYMQRCAAIFGVKEDELTKDIEALRSKLQEKPEEGKFFAYAEAESKIKDKKQVNILSQFNEVVEAHLRGDKNYIGMNCAPLHKDEILKLKKLTLVVIFDEFIVDGFDKLTKHETFTVMNLKRLISYGFDVRLRNGTEIKIDEETGKPFEIQYINFPDWYITSITALLSKSDDVFTGYAIDHIAELLSYLPESSRMTKVSNVQAEFKNHGVKLIIGDFKKILATFMKKNAKTFEPSSEIIMAGDNPMNLNQEQFDDLNRYQHYYEKNAIYHLSKAGHIAKISNFVITPIIHSNTSTGHFKLFEITNEYGLKVNISLDTKDMNDVRRFKCACEEKGNFVFKGQQFELDNIKERLYSNTTYSNEIEQLGWQSEGFWAWADGITTVDGRFTRTDDNGLISVGDKNYLIKPFSNLYAHDKTVYLNEKKFLHLTSNIAFKEWSSRYVDVFGENAMLSICTLVTCIYSDAVFKLVHGELPLLNFFGPKGTGKTQQADSLLAFFGEKQPINNLSKVTLYGLAQTLKSFVNSFCLVDEYKNSLDMKYVESLKSIYNRQAKIQGNFATQGTKTEHIPINQMVLLCGQDLPTLDVALLERCICLTAYKNEYNDEQVNRYKELKDIEEKGLAHLTDDFIRYREYVIEQFANSNALVQSFVSEKCQNISVRLQKNLTTILTPYYILKGKFEFPFTFKKVLNFGIRTISEQQKFIESSDDLKNFWSIFATLIEQKKIKEGRNYVLADVCEMRYAGRDEVVHYSKGMMCLFIRWDGLYPMYAQYARMSNMPALGEKTIQFYLEKTKYYQGKIKAKRFADKDTKEQWNHQAWCFDYNNMDVNLIVSTSIESDNEDMKPNENNPAVAAMIEKNKEKEELKKEEEAFKNAQRDLPF